jgi:hypothetical protein
MQKLFAIFFIVIGLQGFSQALPYINASRGNLNECVVDKDTNIYLFRLNQLEKYNKSLHPLWVKQYDSLEISNILLSKTNALFFISGNKVGKMDAAGSIIWCKKISANINNMMLNYQNHLIIASSEGLFKMDTLGNVIYCKKFNFYINNIGSVGYVINDSMGVYELITICQNQNMGTSVIKYKYSENLDVIFAIRNIPNLYPTEVLFNVYVSNFSPNTIYIYCRQYPYGSSSDPSFGYIEKFINDKVIYKKKYNTLLSTYPTCDVINNMTEDRKGNLYFSQSFNANEVYPNITSYLYPHHVDVFKIDSLGNLFSKSRFLDDLTTSSYSVNTKTELGTFHYTYNSHYLFTFSGSRGYSLNKPIVSIVDSSNKSICSTDSVIPFNKSIFYFYNDIASIQNSTDISYTCLNQSIIPTVVNSFVPDTNYCMTLNVNELIENDKGIIIS